MLSFAPPLREPSVRLVLLVASLLALTPLPSQADVWRVDNDPNNVADFRTLQEAHDAASAGDTLYVAGSSTRYSDLTLTKTLTLIGPGYFLNENPNTQASPFDAILSTVTFDAGSEESVLMGCAVRNGLSINASSVTIKRNRVTGDIGLGSGASNSVIVQNYVNNNFRQSAAQDVLIVNNYLRQGIDFTNTSGGSAQIINNVIAGGLDIGNSIVQNNILTSEAVSVSQLATNTFAHNISAGEQFGTANGNQANVDMATVFVGPDGNSTDGQWQLADGSPALEAGLQGGDVGMFGGNTPYVLSGIPPIPTIYSFSAAGSGSSDSGLRVQIQVKSNQ
jgi:hypothetical protein